MSKSSSSSSPMLLLSFPGSMLNKSTSILSLCFSSLIKRENTLLKVLFPLPGPPITISPRVRNVTGVLLSILIEEKERRKKILERKKKKERIHSIGIVDYIGIVYFLFFTLNFMEVSVKC